MPYSPSLSLVRQPRTLIFGRGSEIAPQTLSQRTVFEPHEGAVLEIYVTASVIALIGALRAVTKGCKTIANLGKAPKEFRGLMSEIDSVHAYLGMLHSVLEMGFNAQAFSALDLSPFDAALSRLKGTVQELQLALKEVETNSESSDNGRKVSKIKWQVYRSQVTQLRDRVRRGKQDLADNIGLLQLGLGVLHTNLLPNAYDNAEASCLRHNNASSGESQSMTSLNSNQNGVSVAGDHDRIPRCCTVSCPCRCHWPSSTSPQPSVLNTALLIISVFFKSSHWDLSFCDDLACRDISQQKLALVYQTPLFHYAISLRLAWNSTFSRGASLHLRVARIVSHYNEAFDAARYGTVRRMRYLSETRRAYPNDTNEYGEGLLLEAIYYRNHKIINYLIEVGVDAFHQDDCGRSPVSIIHLDIKYRRLPIDNRNKLHLLAQEQWNLNSPKYILHEALAKGGISEIQLILDKYPSLVNQPAENNYTPLHLAALIANCHEAIELLLARGADPHKLDIAGRVPLHYAIIENDYKAAEILLRFNSDINMPDRFNTTLLDYALYYSSSNVLSLLLSTTAKVPNRALYSMSDSFTQFALKPRHYSRDKEDIEALAHHLLNSGITFEDEGQRAIEEAVKRDNTHIVDVLLKLGAKVSRRYEGRYNALHHAGLYATLGTIETLRRAKIEGIDPDEEHNGWTAMELFEWRETRADEKLFVWQTTPTAEESASFRALINEIRERNNNEKTTLDADGLEDSTSNGENFRLEDKEAQEADEQLPVPGRWIE
ncbi:ankyrin [Xylariaceae sp. FL1651]|nr:ankyrin [Xylariaceae sp. FL1651]